MRLPPRRRLLPSPKPVEFVDVVANPAGVASTGLQMPGHSGTPLAKKLGLKDGHHIALCGAPPGFRDTLEPVPAGVRWETELRGPLDCVILFASEAAALRPTVRRAVSALAPAGMLWIAWPKQAAKVPTDLTAARVRTAGLEAGLVDVKVCAISDVWAGLKFVRRLKDR